MKHTHNFTHKILPALLMLAFCPASFADELKQTENEENETGKYAATLPTVHVVAQSDSSVLKGYVNYGEAAATRNGLLVKEIPQSVDILNIQKNKNYGTNDLSSILEGNAGIDATYDMRGESIYIRGFQADANDIYRDGVRESGQVRRSTANIERVEILKGPSSVLYGRSNGGGVINMVSKYANFHTSRNVGLLYGSYGTRNGNIDLNQAVNDHVAVRLVGEVGENHSFRDRADSKNRMISPSITVRTDKLRWTGEYLYDYAKRIPDRNPSKSVYDQMGIGYRKGFAHPGDFATDRLQTWRSNLSFDFNDNWKLEWQLARRKASQDFDYFYGGSYNAARRLLNQNYAWQQTDNTTLSNTLTLNGKFKIGRFDNHLTVGYDYSKERRNPTIGTRRNNNINPYAGYESWEPSGRLSAATIRNRHKAETHGLFVQNIFSATPQLKIAAGGRYEQFRFSSVNIRNRSSSYKGHHFSPNLGVVWDVNPQHTLYAGFHKSYSPYGGGSGYLGIDAASDSATFNTSPEMNKQYEAGIKSSWLDNRLSTTLAVYHMEHYNRRYRPTVEIVGIGAVRGKERSRGIELGATGQLAKKWYLRASLGWMSAKVLDDKESPALSGKPLSNTSKFQGNVFLRFIPTEHFYAEAGLTASGKRYANSVNRSGKLESSTLPGFVRLDMMAGYTRKNWNITGAVTNVLNQKYWRSDSMPGNPRSFTLRVNYSF